MASVKCQGSQCHRGGISTIHQGIANRQRCRLPDDVGAETNGKIKSCLTQTSIKLIQFNLWVKKLTRSLRNDFFSYCFSLFPGGLSEYGDAEATS